MKRMNTGTDSDEFREVRAAPHDEWLIDEAVEGTFPASDPSSAGQPGSIVSIRYAAQQRARRAPSRQRRSRGTLWLAAAGVALAVVLWVTRHTSGRNAVHSDRRRRSL